MPNELVTVIVCIYNGEKYLKECVDSVINQDYTNIEVILVDDGSTDTSPEIVDSYKNDNRVKIIHQKNSGVSISRNNALAISNGKYVCIIDQDDAISTDYISYLYNLCVSNDADIALTPTVDKFFDRTIEDNSIDHVSVITGREAVITMLYHKFVIAPWNKIIKKSLIDSNDIKFNPDYFNGEGFAFSIECFQVAKKVVVGNRKVYHYRVGDPNTGASVYKEQYIYSSVNAQKYILSKLKFADEDVMAAWKFSNWHTHCDAFNIMVGCRAKNENIKLYNELKEECKKNALLGLKAPVSAQQKLRGILFKISPHMAAMIINHFRIRKFKTVGGGG